MPHSLSILGGAGAQFFDNSGLPLAGGKIGTYLAGTTTPAATYTSSAAVVLNPNPIVLDSAGRPPEQIWLTDGTAYKFTIATSTDVVLRTEDNLYGVAPA
jgi:hypothetical protein